MKTWSFYVQFNGDEVSEFRIIKVLISNKLYDKVMRAVDKGLPLEDQPFYDELIAKGEKKAESIAAQMGLDELEDWGTEKPVRKDYVFYEDYKEALEEYNEERDEALERWCYDRVDALDPGAFPRFKKKVIGLSFPKWAGEPKKELEYQRDDEAIEYHELTLYLDENGTVTDVSDLDSSALESETMKSSEFGPCCPAYDFVYYRLLDEAGLIEEEEDEE